MNNVENIPNVSEALTGSNWLKSSSHKTSFITRKEEKKNDSFGIEMTPQESNGTVLEQQFHLPKACCCCVSISTGAAGLKEKD